MEPSSQAWAFSAPEEAINKHPHACASAQDLNAGFLLTLQRSEGSCAAALKGLGSSPPGDSNACVRYTTTWVRVLLPWKLLGRMSRWYTDSGRRSYCRNHCPRSALQAAPLQKDTAEGPNTSLSTKPFELVA